MQAASGWTAEDDAALVRRVREHEAGLPKPKEVRQLQGRSRPAINERCHFLALIPCVAGWRCSRDSADNSPQASTQQMNKLQSDQIKETTTPALRSSEPPSSIDKTHDEQTTCNGNLPRVRRLLLQPVWTIWPDDDVRVPCVSSEPKKQKWGHPAQ